MVNHLRIALKHIQNGTARQLTRGNYQVSRIITQGVEAILITHLKFKGKEKYNTCRWVPQNKAIFICPGADAIPEETIFVIRSIKRLGMQVKYIISSDNTDVTEQYSSYLQD